MTVASFHFCLRGVQIEKPLKSANMRDVVSQWDADFITIDNDLLFELILVTSSRQSLRLMSRVCFFAGG